MAKKLILSSDKKIASNSRGAYSNKKKELNKRTNHKYRKEQNEVRRMELALKNDKFN